MAASIVDLPAELLQQIANDLLPNGIESFCLSCKTLYNASYQQRKRHNALKAKYQHVVIKDWLDDDESGDDEEEDDDSHSDSDEDSPSEMSCILQLLDDIGKNPIIARYIETADLSGDNSEFVADGGLGTTCRELFKQVNLLPLVEGSEYLREAGIDPQDWHDKILAELGQDGPHGSPDDPLHSLVLLLTLLPNVTEIALPKYFGSTPGPESAPNDIWKLYDLIVQKANSTGIEASLARLQKICPSTYTGYEERNALANYAPFMSIASVTAVHEGSCIALADGYTGLPFWRRYDSFGTNLEILELAGCIIGGNEMRDILENCARLRVLRISHETKWHGCGWEWNAGNFVAAICQSPAAQTLEVLSLSTVSSLNRVVTGVGDLKALKNLTRLEFDVTLLDGPPFREYAEWERSSERTTVEKSFDDTLFDSGSSAEILPLRDFLPDSVLRVTLLGLLTMETLESIWAKLFLGAAKWEKKFEQLRLRFGSPLRCFGVNRSDELSEDPRLRDIVDGLEHLGGTYKIEGDPTPRPRWMDTFHLR
jgi:hypothetical protein